jgi:hypothetical protein
LLQTLLKFFGFLLFFTLSTLLFCLLFSFLSLSLFESLALETLSFFICLFFLALLFFLQIQRKFSSFFFLLLFIFDSLELCFFIFLLLQLILLHLLKQYSVLLTLNTLCLLQTCLIRGFLGLQVRFLLLDGHLKHFLPLLGFKLLKFVKLFDEVLVVRNNFDLTFL